MEALNIIEGDLTAAGLKFAIVVSRFNSFVTDRLLAGALDTLERSGGRGGEVDVVRIPRPWEFPLTVRAIAAPKKHDALNLVGAVIRGRTPHLDYLSGYAAPRIAPPRPALLPEALSRGLTKSLRGGDAQLTKHADHWRLERRPAVDRNILRLAVYEILFTDTPPAVVIDEALELAKKFSGDESVH